MRNGLVLLVVLCTALIVTASSVATAAPVPASSMQWAERLLETASGPPTKYASRRDAKDAEAAFASIVRKYGANKESYIGLGNSRMLLGQYPDAASSFESAIRMSPKDKTAKSYLSQAKQLAQIAESAVKFLPFGQTVMRVLPYPNNRQRSQWLVLSATVNKPSDPSFPWIDVENVTLTALNGTAADIHKVWQAEKLGCSGYTDGEFNDIQLFVYDLTGDRVPEAVVSETFIGADWLPSHLDVFTLRNRQMVKLIGVKSQFPVRIEDLNHDGRYEIMSDYVIGDEPPHVDQPFWNDIYAYRSGTYVIADLQFPEGYRRVCSDVTQTLKRYPNDAELLMYRGRCYQIFRNPMQALSYYRKAESILKTQPNESKAAQRRNLLQRWINEVEKKK